MKKILIMSLAFFVALVFFACTDESENSERLNELFDERTQSVDSVGSGEDAMKDSSDTQQGNQGNQNNAENTETKEEAKKEEVFQEPPFSHSDDEKLEIRSRYLEAEAFYYDILYQNFELDNMDVITFPENGYETEYHRVILEDINSMSELRGLYLLYFTESFVSGIDFSAYREENGKLYCAQTAGTPKDNAKYTFSVESIDEQNAVVIKKHTDGNPTFRIPAVKSGDVWYFSGVALK